MVSKNSSKLELYRALEEYNANLKEQRRRVASKNIIDFTRYTMDDFRESWHHRKIASVLDEFVNKEIPRLILDLPPRHTKSEFVSRRLPAYIYGINPNAKIISCSYGADLASMMNRDVQNIITSNEYKEVFPDTKLNDSNVRTDAHGSYLRNSEIFEIVGHKGVYKCAGVTGPITGYGFDYGIIDDPFKNRAEAESPTYSQNVWEWYTSTFRTRKQKGACILITMTRWNKKDLVGRVLKLAQEDPKADQWEVFSLPALTDDEPLSKYDERAGAGLALWPDEFSEEDLLTTKATITPYDWLSLYQQRPSAVTGNLVNESDFKYCTLSNGVLTLKDNSNDQLNKTYLLSQCRIFQTCDPAASEKESADYFALGTWAQTPFNELALIDLIHTRMEKPKQLPLMRQQYQNWHPITQWIATKGLGLSLYQDLRANGLPVNKVEEESDKVSRFITSCNKISSGVFYILDNLPHKTEYKTELLDFPKGEHDDFVDITSTAAHVVINYPFDLQTYETYTGYAYSQGGLRV